MVGLADSLRAARALIESPDRWSCGCPRWEFDEYCIATALHKVGGYAAGGKVLRGLVGGESLIRFNATHSHAEVLALFDRGIAASEAAK
jgi:hypothetical protein